MVARSPLGVAIERMTLADLPQVEEIERQSFTTPWPPGAYRSELESNRLAYYVVARFAGQVVGFAGLWMMVDEAHVTTFAVRQGWRRHGVGERLLIALMDVARSRHAREATLEVRPSNKAARRLYEKYGFELAGLRPRYYSDDNEDALIMTTPPLDRREMRDRLAQLRADLESRPAIELGPNGLPLGGTEADEGAASGEHAKAAEGSNEEGLRPSSVRRTR